jgi:hypothetical protein
MESKNIHLVDEHGANRDGNIICSMDIDGSDYVLYMIERDSESDNLFVSKLIKNTDGTSNMMNIESDDEKAKVVNVVKQLVTHSINNEADTLVGGKVTLSDGKEVKISSVLFNKEQNFMIPKAYITTVKKPVTKVCEDFYKVEVPSKVEEETVEPVVSPVVDEVMPELETVKVEPVVDEVRSEEEKIMDSLAEGTQPVVPEVKVEEPVQVAPAPVIEDAVPPVEVKVETPAVSLPETEDVDAKINVIAGPEDVVPEVTPAVVPAVSVEPEEKDIPVIPAPVIPPVPPVVTPDVPKEEPVTTIPKAPEAPGLVFDASKETNLSLALGEVTTEKPLPVDNVETIREFGQDEPVMATPAAAVVPTPEEEVIPAPAKGRGGFANNKFFMVIAIAFFVAACVFLGYEVFQYFQLTK